MSNISNKFIIITTKKILILVIKCTWIHLMGMDRTVDKNKQTM